MCIPSTNQVPLNVKAGPESNIGLGLRSQAGPTGVLPGRGGSRGGAGAEKLGEILLPFHLSLFTCKINCFTWSFRSTGCGQNLI